MNSPAAVLKMTHYRTIDEIVRLVRETAGVTTSHKTWRQRHLVMTGNFRDAPRKLLLSR
jgi:hypothetical protein